MDKRIEVLDLWRSLCVAAMIVWHGFYDMALFGYLDMALMESPFARTAAFLTAGSFILISGICSRFSRNNLRRGFNIFCAGFAVALVMALMKMPVAFGILQFFGVAMILYGLGKDRLDAMKGMSFPIICMLLFALSWVLTRSVQVGSEWLYPLGFRNADFYSADYYPLLPWIFLFAAGTWLGGKIAAHRDCAILSREFAPALTFMGRHSLIIYLLHQPLLYGIFMIFKI